MEDHIKEHEHVEPQSPFFPYFLFPFLFCKTTLTASLNIYFNPSWVRALHSMYLHFIYSSIIFLAVYLAIGALFGSLLFFYAYSLKSILFPTKIFGALGTQSSSSGNHFLQNIIYLFLCVQERRRINNRKTNNKHIAMRICQRSQSVVLFLSCCIPRLSTKYHKPRLTIFPSTLIVVAKLSNTVGSYTVGNLFSVQLIQTNSIPY